MEHNPRVVFERLFGDGGSTDTESRLARMERNRSILDSVSDKVASLQRRLGPGDGSKLAEYLDAIRDVERRIQRSRGAEYPRAARASTSRPACRRPSKSTPG